MNYADNVAYGCVAVLFGLVVLACQTAAAAGFPMLEKGMCGPAESFHTQLEQAGFTYSSAITLLASDGVSDGEAKMIYLATPERARETRESDARIGASDSSLEMLLISHTDPDERHPRGWRCITNVSSIIPSDRRELTSYLSSIAEVYDPPKEAPIVKNSGEVSKLDLAALLGMFLASLLDPLSAGAGIASYFIGKSRGRAAAWIAVVAFGLALAALSAAMVSSSQGSMPAIAWVLRVLAVAGWFGISALVAKLRVIGAS